jgi:4-hydroxy-2-oxoheptanedioate aldolase
MEAILKFRCQLKEGRACLGTAVGLCDPMVTYALAPVADFLWIDHEHGRMSPEYLTGHLLAARHQGAPSLVRVPSCDTASLKMVLDMGADGVIVPMIHDADEVAAVVADCRYPPVGRRGWGPGLLTEAAGKTMRQYADEANAAVFVAVQIETAEALEAIDRIVAVPGVDSLVIGPADLSGALGGFGEYDHPKFLAAVDTIIAKARGAGLSVGAGGGSNAEYVSAMIRRGVQWHTISGDVGLMVQCMKQLAAEVRTRLGQA